MANLRPTAETLVCSVFHGLRAEILYGQGFEKNLQQISIPPTFFNSFPQIVHSSNARQTPIKRHSNATGVWSERQSVSVRVEAKCRRHLLHGRSLKPPQSDGNQFSGISSSEVISVLKEINLSPHLSQAVRCRPGANSIINCSYRWRSVVKYCII